MILLLGRIHLLSSFREVILVAPSRIEDFPVKLCSREYSVLMSSWQEFLKTTSIPSYPETFEYLCFETLHVAR